jgi:hypothetical protein
MTKTGLAGIKGSHKLNPRVALFAMYRLGPKPILRRR